MSSRKSPIWSRFNTSMRISACRGVRRCSTSSFANDSLRWINHWINRRWCTSIRVSTSQCRTLVEDLRGDLLDQFVQRGIQTSLRSLSTRWFSHGSELFRLELSSTDPRMEKSNSNRPIRSCHTFPRASRWVNMSIVHWPLRIFNGRAVDRSLHPANLLFIIWKWWHSRNIRLSCLKIRRWMESVRQARWSVELDQRMRQSRRHLVGQMFSSILSVEPTIAIPNITNVVRVSTSTSSILSKIVWSSNLNSIKSSIARGAHEIRWR